LLQLKDQQISRSLTFREYGQIRSYLIILNKVENNGCGQFMKEAAAHYSSEETKALFGLSFVWCFNLESFSNFFNPTIMTFGLQILKLMRIIAHTVHGLH
jgi:hypothetical protein